ncbi:alpha/beta hydrolase [Sinomonas halotolerans]|uniref:Alpha/beta hydrolase-fold protein n=1 Tax=Sinomonas halotolerans TaxID=1644133 RepID=A0ABU9WWR8_9MICC
MDALLDLRVVDGPVAVAIVAFGALSFLWLIARLLIPRPRGRGVLLLACAALAAPALTAAAHWFLVDAVGVFPTDLPREVLFSNGLALAGILLAVAVAVRGGRAALRPRRWAALLAALLGVLALTAQQVNAYYGLNHTVGDLAGSSLARIEPFESSLERGAAPSVPLAQWRPAGALPGTGELRRVQIPNSVSGFAAREAYVYLPPAYAAPVRPELPVLVLMAGQPGSPADWLTGGQLRGRLDRFARDHGGVAPVVVVVDPIGSPSANTLCMDTRLGRAEAYLTRDVVPWIAQRLTVASGPRAWAAGGFSFGGTCSVQLLAKHPELFGAALAFAPEKEPALAKERAKTIDGAFDGDAAAFDAQVPAHFFAQGGHEGQFLFLAVGSGDEEFLAQAGTVARQAREGGADVHLEEVPGEGHSWEMVGEALPVGLERLAARWRLP